MRPGHWFFAAGAAALATALLLENYLFMWIGLGALVVGSFLPGGREEGGGGGFGD